MGRIGHEAHEYLSEACFHAEHNACGPEPASAAHPRLPSACRFCGVTCRCACHPAASVTVTRDDFITKITAARKDRGWTQAWLAQLVGTSQQTISAWENGSPPPSGATLQRLCAALGLEPDLDRDFATPLTLPTLDTLPLRNLAPSQFTAFVLDLIAAMFPEADIDTPVRHRAIDVSLTTPSGERIGVKCIQGRRFDTASFDKARSETDVDASGLDRCLLLLRGATSPAVQEHAAAHPVWEVWDVQTLVDHVRDLDTEVAFGLVERHFPGLAAPFLGLDE